MNPRTFALRMASISTVGLATMSTLVLSGPAAFAATKGSQQTPAATAPKQPTSSVTVMLDGAKLLSVNRVVAVDPSSHHPTTWLSAMEVESVLRDLGLDAHWVPGVNQLVINMPLGFTVPASIQVPYRAPKEGQFITLVNAKTVAIPPMLDKGQGAYIPLYYVMQTLKALGISSQWTGQKWLIAGKVHVPTDTSMGGDVGNTFTLQLSNQTDPSLPDLPAPPVPPDDAMNVTLPMNGLLHETKQKLIGSNENIPMEDYVQTGRAGYIVDKPIAAVEYWFNAAYTAQGFSSFESGSYDSLKTGDYVESTVYTPNQQHPGQQEMVAMSYKSLGPNQTEVEYFVTDVVIPARPASSQISPNASSMAVTVTSTGQGKPVTTTKTIIDSAAIAKVIATANTLSAIDPPGINPGGPMIRSTQDAKVVFTYADGHTVTLSAVKLDSYYGDVVVGNVPLKDNAGTVWSVITAALGQ